MASLEPAEVTFYSMDMTKMKSLLSSAEIFSNPSRYTFLSLTLFKTIYSPLYLHDKSSSASSKPLERALATLFVALDSARLF